jgi:hypothetical protein
VAYSAYSAGRTLAACRFIESYCSEHQGARGGHWRPEIRRLASLGFHAIGGAAPARGRGAQFRQPAPVRLKPVDDGVAGGTKGDQPGMPSRLPMVHGWVPAASAEIYSKRSCRHASASISNARGGRTCLFLDYRDGVCNSLTTLARVSLGQKMAELLPVPQLGVPDLDASALHRTAPRRADAGLTRDLRPGL